MAAAAYGIHRRRRRWRRSRQGRDNSLNRSWLARNSPFTTRVVAKRGREKWESEKKEEFFSTEKLTPAAAVCRRTRVSCYGDSHPYDHEGEGAAEERWLRTAVKSARIGSLPPSFSFRFRPHPKRISVRKNGEGDANFHLVAAAAAAAVAPVTCRGRRRRRQRAAQVVHSSNPLPTLSLLRGGEEGKEGEERRKAESTMSRSLCRQKNVMDEAFSPRGRRNQRRGRNHRRLQFATIDEEKRRKKRFTPGYAQF